MYTTLSMCFQDMPALPRGKMFISQADKKNLQNKRSDLVSKCCHINKSEVTSAEKKKKIKMVVSKHLTHFCYPIRLVLHQHLNSYVAYSGIPPENSNYTRGRYQHLPLYPLLRLLWSKSDKTISPERGFSTSITLELHLVQPHCTRITKHGHHLWHHMRNLIQ